VHYFIDVDQDLLLRFSRGYDFLGVAAVNSMDGFNIFDEENDWIGLLIRVNESDENDEDDAIKGVYVSFGANNNWMGIVV
jgi:hypothetical protein